MRGTPTRASYCSRPAGIIPAYAGNTPAACWKSWQAWDHPRVCGEHFFTSVFRAKSMGSSPRMRGTPCKALESADYKGIIPAYAGNTDWTVYDPVRHGDHPRVCGEHPTMPYGFAAAAGSSPRMRGTLWLPQRKRCGSGIIPAYAGNTGNLALNLMNWRDHPRVCGEHATVTVPPTDSTGSSPRMRGTHMVILPQICDTGIIPAYAGNTPCRAPAWNWWRDHPRVCGEHYTLRCGMACSLGSSPRMRGTHRRRL